MEHLTQKQIEDYSQNRLGTTELLALSEHLAACEVCRQQVDANDDRTFFALHEEVFAGNGEASAHLSFEQTADYVDKNLGGEELLMAVDHLSNCEQCVVAVNDLRAFRNEIAPSLDREYAPAIAVPAVAAPHESAVDVVDGSSTRHLRRMLWTCFA